MAARTAPSAPDQPIIEGTDPAAQPCAIPCSYQEAETSILSRPKATPACGVMGPYFTLEKSRLQFQGLDVGKIIQQFNQSIRLARSLAKVLGVDDPNAILSTALNTMENVHGVDVFHMTHGRPLVVADVAEDFLSPTALGTHLGFQKAPATAVNLCLEAMGMQIRGSGSTLYTPTTKGRAYATFRSFPKNETECLVHLFWRPSVLPLLEAYVSSVPRPPSPPKGRPGGVRPPMEPVLVQVGQTEIGGEVVSSVNARELHAFLMIKDNFANWIKDRINQYQFIENQDFVSFLENAKKPKGGRPSREYQLTLDMAKELSMIERTPKGKEARQYFLACERALYRAGGAVSLPGSEGD